jgi:mannose-6-phosphate isomerase-like protein (cupin superfamily)
MSKDNLVDTASILENFNMKEMNTYFQTFMHNSSFEVGIIKLESGQKDTQGQHSVDELYFVIQGEGFITIKDQEHQIRKGSCVFVRANTPHHFHGNKEQLIVLYIFTVV